MAEPINTINFAKKCVSIKQMGTVVKDMARNKEEQLLSLTKRISKKKKPKPKTQNKPGQEDTKMGV